MKISVIGASIAGLTAGKELATAGHEVVVFEKSGEYGGRLATMYTGEEIIDYGITKFAAENTEFQNLVKDLTNQKVIKTWGGNFAHRDSKGSIQLYQSKSPFYIAPAGMSTIAKHIGRNLDIRFNVKVGGLTHIGENRRKKRSWMLNFPSALTESVDAVIIATPPRQAYALLNTTTDEIETLKLIREIDEVEYESQFSLMLGIKNTDLPEWNELACEDDVIQSVTNEASKRDSGGTAYFVVHTTSQFAKNHINADPEQVEEKILTQLSEIMGGWVGLADWRKLHFWRYSRVKNPLPHNFMEIKGNDTPLALVGDYMNGDTIESAYLSGLKLANHWLEQYRD